MKRYVFGALGAAALCYSIVPTYGGKLLHRLRRPEPDNTLYLTFDDGPDPVYTPQLLDLLAKYGIRASFFVVAQSAKQYPGLIARMKREGHLVGLHSLRHKNGMLQLPVSACRDFERAACIMQQLGAPAFYYRAPWGHWNIASLAELYSYGMKPVLWDIMAQDWRGDTTAEEIARKLRKRTCGGSIICLHDGRGKNDAPARTIAALRDVLPDWLDAGFRFDTVDHYEH